MDLSRDRRFRVSFVVDAEQMNCIIEEFHAKDHSDPPQMLSGIYLLPFFLKQEFYQALKGINET